MIARALPAASAAPAVRAAGMKKAVRCTALPLGTDPR